MPGSVIFRHPHTVEDGKIVRHDATLTWEEADARAGFRLDRRKSWAFIPSEDCPELCAAVTFTTGCSGCLDTEDYQHHAVGGGCSECGYTGKSRRSEYVPYMRERDDD